MLRYTLDRCVTEVKGKTYFDFTFALIGRLRLVSYNMTIASSENPLKSKIFWKKTQHLSAHGVNAVHNIRRLPPSFELRAPSSKLRDEENEFAR